ncbi:MAG: hypothetical protein AABX33_07060 [Nanoarchaeota archaeon]
MEFFFFIVMILGIITALSAPSAFISYIIIFLAGMIAGRLIYERKRKIKLPYIMIIAGFLIGYLIGVYYGNVWIIIILFIIGGILSFRLYNNKILRDVRF